MSPCARPILLIVSVTLIAVLIIATLPPPVHADRAYGTNVYPIAVPLILNQTDHTEYQWTDDTHTDLDPVAEPWPDGPTRTWSAEHRFFEIPISHYATTQAVVLWPSFNTHTTSVIMDPALRYPGIYHDGPADGSSCPLADVGCYHEALPLDTPSSPSQQDNHISEGDWLSATSGVKATFKDELDEHQTRGDLMILPMYDIRAKTGGYLYLRVAKLGAFRVLAFTMDNRATLFVEYLGDPPPVPAPATPTVPPPTTTPTVPPPTTTPTVPPPTTTPTVPPPTATPTVPPPTATPTVTTTPDVPRGPRIYLPLILHIGERREPDLISAP